MCATVDGIAAVVRDLAQTTVQLLAAAAAARDDDDDVEFHAQVAEQTRLRQRLQQQQQPACFAVP